MSTFKFIGKSKTNKSENSNDDREMLVQKLKPNQTYFSRKVDYSNFTYRIPTIFFQLDESQESRCAVYKIPRETQKQNSASKQKTLCFSLKTTTKIQSHASIHIFTYISTYVAN